MEVTSADFIYLHLLYAFLYTKGPIILVQSFKYVGIIINEQRDPQQEIRRR